MSTPRTSVKMAALAPMPSASVLTTTNVNPGDLRSWRKANLRSFISLSASRLNRVDTCGAPRRNETRRGRDQCQHSCNCEIDRRIEHVDFEKDVLPWRRR